MKLITYAKEGTGFSGIFMMTDAAPGWSFALTIYETIRDHQGGGLFLKSWLPVDSLHELPVLFNWQSWLNSDVANNVKELQASNINLISSNYNQFAMIILFLIMTLGTLWLVTLYNLYLSKGKVKKGNSIIEEVSHKLDQQSRFLRTQEQLLDRLRNQNNNLRKQQSSLFAVINHELKNPLTAIKTNFVAWFRLASYDEVTLDRARMVESSIARLEAFCEQAGSMRDLDRQDNSSTSFSQLLNHISESYIARNLDNTGVSINVQSDADYKVPGKTSQLAGLVSNLLKHSVKRTPSGGSINLELQATDGGLVLILAEPECSTPTKTATYVELAQQVEIEHAPELFFASRIAQFLNVIITTRSDAKNGTVTSVTFPEFEVLQANQQTFDDDTPLLYFDHQRHPVMEFCGPSSNSPRCLVLDDDPQLQSCLGRILSKHFNVKGVFDIESAMTETKQWQPNLIITEAHLISSHAGTRCDVFDAIEKMKCRSETNDLPVIILTTQNTVENRLKALDMNIFTFFGKPFSEDLLSKTALRLCSNTAATKELQNIKDKLPFQQSRETIFLNQLNALIEDNLDNVDFHFEDYFEQFSLSKRQFFRRVNALTRCTPKQYLINKRLELARHLLSKGVLLAKVTKSCGFRDAKTLTKLYQAHYGEEII